MASNLEAMASNLLELRTTLKEVAQVNVSGSSKYDGQSRGMHIETAVFRPEQMR